MTARKDNRLVVTFRRCNVGWLHVGSCQWEACIDEPSAMIAVGPYTRRASAKRGMVRFLRRIGADPARVRWEGEG